MATSSSRTAREDPVVLLQTFNTWWKAEGRMTMRKTKGLRVLQRYLTVMRRQTVLKILSVLLTPG
jgi:hypothetical protein